MAIAILNAAVNTEDATEGSSYTVTDYTVSAGSNTILIVRVGFYAESGTDESHTTSLTWNGDALTLLGTSEITSGTARYSVEIWYILNPDTGNNILLGAIDRGTSYTSITPMVISGASQSISVVTATEADTSGNDPSPFETAVVTTDDNSFIVDMFFSGGIADRAVSAGQTQDITEQGSYKAVTTAGSYNMGWTYTSSGVFCHVVSAFAPADASSSSSSSCRSSSSSSSSSCRSSSSSSSSSCRSSSSSCSSSSSSSCRSSSSSSSSSISSSSSSCRSSSSSSISSVSSSSSSCRSSSSSSCSSSSSSCLSSSSSSSSSCRSSSSSSSSSSSCRSSSSSSSLSSSSSSSSCRSSSSSSCSSSSCRSSSSSCRSSSSSSNSSSSSLSSSSQFVLGVSRSDFTVIITELRNKYIRKKRFLVVEQRSR